VIEHQRLGHIGTDRLLELARGGKLKEGFETYKNDPFKTADCKACLSAKITRHPKSGDAPKLRGGSWP
jgi:phosphoribosyl 1,2-cyclic phosphodiesterase